MFQDKHRRQKWIFWLSVIIPLVLICLFYAFRNHSPTMIFWSEQVLPSLIHPWGKLTALLPFSLGEATIILAVLAFPSILLWQKYHSKGLAFLKIIPILLLWLGAGLCWLWNPLYYVPTLAQRSGLDTSPYPVEDLVVLTHYFAQGASTYSTQVTRNDDLQFAVPQEEYFQEALDLYQGIEEEFPFLAMDNVETKSLRLSYLQSYFGFTGVYNPFTGEANINVHAPPVLQPATIAHEMAHQRLIAPELEANFLAVVACLDSPSNTYRYSGYLFGLMQLSNALYSVAPEEWREIIPLYFTPEMTHDWEENYEYWQNFQSPAEEVAKEVYDGFLKSNDQELGIRSYGACVDLLTAYYRQEAQTWYAQQVPEPP